MTNAKPTPGPVRVWPNDITGHCEILPEGAAGPVIARINPFSVRSEAQGWADAHLIAEAFNVHHETGGLTPRQLAEQREELIEALEGAIGALEADIEAGYNEGDVDWVIEAKARLDRATQAIARAKGEK